MSVRAFAYRGVSLSARLGAALLLILGLANTAAASILSTTTTVSASPSPSVYGQSVTFTATIIPGDIPSGTVTFHVGAQTITVSTMSGGTATTTLTNLAAGSYSYTAEYNGHPLYTGSTSATHTHVVGPAPTDTTLTTSPVSFAKYGDSVTFTANVTPSTATGTVSFQVGPVLLGPVAVVNGTASVSSSTIPAGSQSITATFTPSDPNYAESDDGGNILIQAAVTNTSVVSTPATWTLGTDISFTATVYATGIVEIPTGTVRFFVDSTTFVDAALNASGVATANLFGFTGYGSGFTAGIHTIQAQYLGSANFLTSNSGTPVAPDTQQDLRSGTTTTVVSSLNPSTVGATVTFTASVTETAAMGGHPFGTMNFVIDGGSPLAVPTDAGGIATFTTSALAVGPHSVVATFTGASTYRPSTSATLTQTVIGTGLITIVVDPSGGFGTFNFTGSFDDESVTTFGAPESMVFTNVPAGSYAFNAVPHPTFALLAVSCDDPDSGSSVNAATGAVTIDVDADEAITCTFLYAEAQQRTEDIIAGFLERRQNTLVSVGPSFQHLLDRFRGTGSTGGDANALAYFGAQMLAGQDSAFSTFFANPASPFAIWLEGRYDRYRDGGAGSQINGSVFLIQGGLDYLIGPHALIGVMLSGDFAHEHSDDLGYDVRGQGLLVGPYFALEAGGLVIDARLLWGKSWNAISPFLTYTDNFTTTRLLASARISGELNAGNFFIQPAAEIVWLRETQQAYIDANAIPVPEQTVTTGRVTFGPRIGLNLITPTLAIQPSILVEGVWDFVNNDLTARLGAGLTIAGQGGIRLELNAGLDGLGSQMRSWSVGGTLTIPLGGT